MYRNRLTRKSRYRDPNNLHVIPTASVVNKVPMTHVQTPVMQQAFSSVIPVLIPPANVLIPPANVLNPPVNFFGTNSNNYPDTYNKKRRKRGRRKRNQKPFANKNVLPNPAELRWFNSNASKKVNNVANVPMKTETEKVVVPEAPIPAEEDFEEVEVASSEGDAKRIPVGFRKTKLQYLNYKQNSFFKPKFYNFSPQRIVVNCLNVADDVSVDCDVVSEAEYDECEIDNLDPCDAIEKFGKIIEIEDEDEMTDEAEEETGHDTNNEREKDSTHVVTDETEVSSHAISDKVNKELVHSVSNKVDEKSKCSASNEVTEKSVAKKVNKKSTDVDAIGKAGKESVPDKKTVTTLKTRTYKACIEGSDDLKQGKSLIQEKLDAWESHLIGLEYLLEICGKNETSVLKYYCVLCDEEHDVQELPEVYVINHVSGSNHVAKYLEKHFPSCGFKFNENSNYDFVLFQKLCEKINEKLGYYFMCITKNDYYTENKVKIKEIIQKSSHPSEKDFKFEKDMFEKTVDSELSENIHIIIEDVIKKVIPKDEITTTELKKDAEGNKSNLEGKLTDKSIKNSAPKADKPKYKGNNSISTYLRLNFAATNKLKLPSNKGKNKKSKLDTEQTVENVKSQNEVNKNVKSHSEQEIAGNVNEKIVKNVKSKNNQSVKSLKQKNVVKVQSKNVVIETITLEDDEPEDNVEIKKEPGIEAQDSTDNSAPVESHEVTSNIVKNDANKKVIKTKEKVLLKTTIHSKHCRKRILDNGMARLRLAAKKATPKTQLVKSVTAKGNSDTPKKIISKKIKPELKESKIAITSTFKKKPAYNIISAQQAPAVESKSPVTGHITSNQKNVQKKGTENSSKDAVSSVNDSSHWIPMRATSPILTSDISLFLKKIATKPSENLVKKRRVSKSPVRRITSPLRLVTKNRQRRHSKSPHRKRNSKSPVRRRSRSPYRKLSKSPIRRSRSPIRRRSRSPQRRRSRSPRRRSRSPRRRSRSPLRHRSRSSGRRSRSPLRRYSRSPLRRLSRSPLRKHSRSPIRRRSRTPDRRHSRSPIKRRSRSPYKRHSRSPVQKFSNNSLPYRNLRQVSSDINQPSSSREYYNPDERYHRNAFNFPKHLDVRESEIARSRDESKMLHSSRINKSDRYKSQALSSASALRGISDLDPVSDEDESIYFSDKHLRPEDTISPSSKLMFSKLIQKFSAPDNSSEPGLNNFLQFMETHKAELEEFIALKSNPKSEKTNTMKIDPNLQQQTLLLQQFLLANLASSIQESVPSVSNVQYTPTQQPFLQGNPALRFGHPPVNLPTPVNMPPVIPQPAPMQPRFFPPNVSVPPPHLFQQSPPQPIQDFSPKPKQTPEVMFKDLKATVSKLFGANESAMKQNIKPQMSGYVTNQLPDPEKWDLNHPNAPKFNVPLTQKNVFPSSGKNANFSGIHENPGMREQVSSRDNNAPGQFVSGNRNERSQNPSVPVPPPDAKVTFCDSPRSSSKANLFPVINPNFNTSTRGGVNDVKVSLAQRLASVLVKIGMVDVPAPLLQEMLMKIGAFSSSPRQDISENEIVSILKRLGYLS